MKATAPTSDDRHAATVTRTPRPDGGACYSIEVTAASEQVIQRGSHLEAMTSCIWIASTINIRLACLAQALVQMAENTTNETVN